MTQPSLLDAVEPADTFTEKVARMFKANAGLWLDGMDIARYGGIYCWRTRVSECRQMGMAIENRQRRAGRRIISEYRYNPA
jgi:hypothetical protein